MHPMNETINDCPLAPAFLFPDGAGCELHSYILLRSDIALAAQLAQCAHAAQEAAFLLPGAPKSPIHVVILSVDSEQELFEAANRLADKGFEPGLFFEPDWPRGHTALFLKPQKRSAKLRAAMGKYRLWGSGEAPANACFELQAAAA